MSSAFTVLVIALVVMAIGAACGAEGPAVVGHPLRPPSVPLVACDPYFSIWSPADRLTDTETTHWTGKPHRLHSLVRVDGKTYRLLGAEPAEVPALPQTALTVLPTRTLYEFANADVRVALAFMTAMMPDDLDVLSRPVTYLTWEVRSTDGKQHAAAVYFDSASELAVNTPDQQVVWSREKVGAMTVLRVGSKDQPILAKKGDDLRIDWGYLYLAPVGHGAEAAARLALASGKAAREAFAAGQALPADDARQPRAAGDEDPSAAVQFDLGQAGAAAASCTVVLAYDDIYSIEYFGQRLRPYWRRNGAEAADLLKAAAADFPSLAGRCKAFDEELMADLTKAGGQEYARLCALAYRQCLAANKLAADANGRPLLFPKECFSNGCIATVDVIYPMDPQFLLFGPTLTKATIQHILDYANSPRWRFPFAPHDLGQYPKANGQRYGGGEKTETNQMPVEETGNMLLLLAALARMEGNADYAARYWPLLTKWAEYLKEKGFDPENQLCTDDFAGHLAHNVNLSAKAIVALGAYATLCDLKGDKDRAATYRNLAREFAARWVKEADDGDHYRLAFDKPGTWSQKYNLVWDRILGLGLFPPEVARKEMAFYRKTQNRYGLPLDNRQVYTKSDWTLWTATLTGSPDDFQALVAPIYTFLNATPDRVPMSDWHMTDTGRKRGFQARPVVGGVFLRMLYEPDVWKKWASRDQTRAANWAPFPAPPEFRTVVPTSQEKAAVWRYTFTRPADDWFAAGFAASSWKEGPAGFGAAKTPGGVVRTEWKTPDIWLRREFAMPEGNRGNLHLLVHHDEDVEVYLNGVPAARAAGYTTEYETIPMSAGAKAALRPGRNVLAVHCLQTLGGQYIDVGLAEEIPAR
jgi:hypothetical protein